MKKDSPRTPWLYAFMYVLLAGCAQRIEEWQIVSMEKQCAPRGGVYLIDTLFLLGAKCRDGKWVFPERAV